LKEIIQLKAEAHSGQDGWHDEGFQMFQTEEMMLSKRLSELQNLRYNAQIIEPEEQNEVVKIGNGVVIEYEDGKTLEFILDGYVITPSKNRVSIYSPLGKILQGARKGEERILLIGKTKRVVKVKEIYSPSVAKILLPKE
jgi:transcription elongation GreA/GreB family factor